MWRLLQIEFHKMRYNRASKVLLIIYFSLFFFITMLASIHFKIGDLDFKLADQGIFNFPYIWHFNTYFAAILKIFLALVIVSMISLEYSNKTLKQNLIDGLSKKEFVLSKFYMILLFSLASTLLIFVVSLVLGLVFSDYTETGIIFSNMEYLLGYFIKLTAFFSFCFFLGVLIKRSAFAIGALFVWSIVESIFKGIVLWEFNGKIGNFLLELMPLEAMSNLIKEPLSKLGIVKSATGIVRDTDLHFYQLLIAAVWIFIFIYGAYRLIQKRDL